jgi:hypothetical protein
MLTETEMLSVKQTSSQIKLLEMWKATNRKNYPIKMDKKRLQTDGIQTGNNQMDR